MKSGCHIVICFSRDPTIVAAGLGVLPIRKTEIDISLASLHVYKRKISYNDRDIVSKAWKERNEEEKTLSYGVNPCQICVCIMNMSLILYEDIT